MGIKPAVSIKESSVKKAAVFLIAILCLVAVGHTRIEAAPPSQQEQSKCLIVAPTNGSLVRGQVIVTGSATHAEFTWYQIGYAPEPNPTGEWKFFHSSETSVKSGQLGIWNTTLIPDGTYQLLIEVHRKDGNFDLCFSKQLRVNNSAPTATFTAAPLPTAIDTPTLLPTPEDTATIVIEQPPTATSRATPTYSPVDNPTPTPQQTQIQLPIDPATVQSASWRGAQIAILAFVVIAAYFVIRNVAASGVRKVWKPRDVEGFHRRRPRQH